MSESPETSESPPAETPAQSAQSQTPLESPTCSGTFPEDTDEYPTVSAPAIDRTDSPTVESETVTPAPFTLSRNDQLVAALLAAIVLALMILRWAELSGWGVRPVEVSELPPIENQFQLDINSATEVEWSQLDGIGEVLAERIVRNRTDTGNFQSVDELLRVEGIGTQTLERIRPWLTTQPTN